MPRAILVFRLPQERAEYELTLAAGDLASSLSAVTRAIRAAEKENWTRDRLVRELREAIDFDALERAGF